jgi:hypothetical protein
MDKPLLDPAVLEFLEQLSGADAQTINGAYVVLKAQQLYNSFASFPSNRTKHRIKAARKEAERLWFQS